MTNTPMTFKEWFAQHDTLAEYSAKQAWQASQAQQASVIAELVEALEAMVASCDKHGCGLKIADDVLAKVKGTTCPLN